MKSKLRVGDWVEVRSKEEILRTLDGSGQIDGMPLMPEMLKFCGQRLQVYRSAHKTCDYSTAYPYHSRWVKDTVHLDTRCDGSAHDGCEAGCLLYWKTAWLKPLNPGAEEDRSGTVAEAPAGTTRKCPGCTEADLDAHTRVAAPADGSTTYVCQATQVPVATTPLAWWDMRQYWEDYWSGNVSLGRLIRSLAYSLFFHISQAGMGVGRPMRWFYNKFYPLWGGTPFPRNPGQIPNGMPTPSAELNLQPGEMVRVKPQREILQTVNVSSQNRGMYWDAELVPYCGGTYRVLRRVTKIIDEKTAKMVKIKNSGVILDGVVCQARYSPNRMLCPKSMYPYWREIWLERVDDSACDGSSSPSQIVKKTESLA